MRRTVVVVLVVALLVIGASQVALAFGPGIGPRAGGENGCWLETLSEEAREQVAAVRESFRETIVALKEKMWSLRDEGNVDEARAVREEMWEAKEEMREEIAPYLPDDFQEHMENRGPRKSFLDRRDGVQDGFRARGGR